MATTARTHIVEADFDGIEPARLAALVAESDVALGLASNDLSDVFAQRLGQPTSHLRRLATRRQLRP